MRGIWDERGWILGVIVLSAVVTALLLTACGAPQRATRAPSMDGAHRDMADCEALAAHSSAPQDALDTCYRERGY
jgi:hypothetical protein